MSKLSALEKDFVLKWMAVSGPPLEREYRFSEARRWRFDFAHPDSRVAIELEGGVWTGGRHTRGAGFINDCEKYNEATYLFWRVFRLTAKQITIPELKLIAAFIRQQEEPLPLYHTIGE